MKLQIYVMTHKQFDVPQDALYQPLHVGHIHAQDFGYPGDDTGENISHLNCYYSELTGHYWLWKNCKDVDYIGTCHYRRYLINEQEKVLTKNEYEYLLKDYDLVTTKRVILNNSYHYGFSANHNIKALDCTGEVIRDLYPEYYDTFITLVHENETYFGNMFVTSKALFDQYCEWLFTIFAEVEKRIDLDTDEDAYHKRVLGFISEFLLLVWVRVNQLKVYECKVGMLGEKAETRELKERLAEYFRQKDIEGAMHYFMQVKTARPDVMMEASDVTGELRLCMQIIVTAGKEQATYGRSVLDRENDFRRLIALFTELNNVIYRKHHGGMTLADEDFLKENTISELALEVAEAVYASIARARETSPEFWERRK
ncbi:MAG: DUF4422 domain-containing protein [Agathobacter sp.]|nr:DUF4422 domain-containing protein [Agathobacter sp.]